METFLCKEVQTREQLRSKKGTVAAITAAVAACLEEEEKALRPAMFLRRPAEVLSSWRSSGREEIMRMRMLWQRRIVPR